MDRFEVIVLDANTCSLKGSINLKLLNNITWIHLGYRMTMPLMRRKAIDYANGEYIAFIDDDCVASNNWLTTMVEYIISNPKIGALQGKVIPYFKHTLMEQFADFDGSQKIPTYKNEEIVNLCTCNCIIRRNTLNDSFLYLDSYQLLESKGLYFVMEDLLISQAIKKSGFSLAYCADAVVSHRHPSKLNTKLHQFYEYGRGAFAYCYVSGTNIVNLPGYKLSKNVNILSLLWLWFNAIYRIMKKYPKALCHKSPWNYRIVYPILCWIIQGAYYVGIWSASKDIKECNIIF